MNLVPNAGATARRAWSLRLIDIAALADLIPSVVPFISGWLPWWLTIALLAAAWGARLIAQPEKEPATANQQDPAEQAG